MEPSKTKTKKKIADRKIDLEMEESDDDMEVEDIDFTKVATKEQLRQQQQGMEQQGMDEEKEWDDEDDLNIEFLFYDPDPNQYHAVRNLINGLLDGLSYNSSQLAELVINQNVVGTMIGGDDGDEKPTDRNVFSFATILNLEASKSEKVIQEILQFIKSKSEKHNSEHEKFVQVLDSEMKSIGLLINERLVNLSPKLVPVLHKQLCEDIAYVKTQNYPEAELFKLKYVIGISKCFKDIKTVKKKVKTTGYDLKEYMYPKFEDYEFMSNAEFSFLFEANTSKNVSGLTNLDNELNEQQCLRMVFLIQWDKYVECVNSLDQLLEP